VETFAYTKINQYLTEVAEQFRLGNMENSLRLASERILEVWSAVFENNPSFETHYAFHKSCIQVTKEIHDKLIAKAVDFGMERLELPLDIPNTDLCID
jgi:hypothetical protein